MARRDRLLDGERRESVEAETRAAEDHEEDDGRELILDRYRLNKRLGTGGFGTVFSARDERLERDVAIKLLPRERVIEARFEREARAAARLQHPGIVTLYEATVDDDGAYLVSELVRGKSLDRLLHDGKLSDREILEVVASLCSALEHAHSSGVIHRDVKPSNVLVLTRSAGSEHPAKLTDFGVARLVGSETVTRTGDVIGTLAYMAPEQAEGREAGPSADLYSVAVVAYEALTGANPLRERTRARPHYRTHVPPLRRQRRDLPRDLGAGLDRALRPRPSERGTLGDLQAAVTAALPHAGEERGIVTDWRLTPTLDDRGGRDPNSKFGAGPASTPALRRDVTLPRVPVSPRETSPPPAWVERGLLAAASGLSAGWLSAHLALAQSVPAPAVVALVSALVVLVLQTVGGPFRLLLLGTALPFGAVILGAISLAGAWPMLVGRFVQGWWRRATIAGAGLLWLAEAGKLTGHDLYWQAGSLSQGFANGLLAAALVWAAAAALMPVLIPRRPRYPRLELALALVGSAVIVAGVEAFGARPLRDATGGAVLGGLIAAAPALTALVKDLRRKAGERPAVS
jgi:eukaryotic-like serine/threonine-protein kinase